MWDFGEGAATAMAAMKDLTHPVTLLLTASCSRVTLCRLSRVVRDADFPALPGRLSSDGEPGIVQQPGSKARRKRETKAGKPSHGKGVTHSRPL